MTAPSEDLYTEFVLPPNQKAIRVLHLEPGNDGDDVRARIQLLNLESVPCPQYDCVSYVWGDPSSTRSAFINEKPIQITTNLHDALRHIRSNSESVIIWADAVCINQSDVDEKGQQVALMEVIYRKCSKVHIWLGMPKPGSLTGDPFEFLEHFAQQKHYHDFPGFTRDEATGQLNWQRNKACDDILNDFLQVAESPWWTRAWTVQECLLPKETTIMFGTRTVTWDYILRSRDMKNNHGDGDGNCCAEALKIFNPRQLFLIDSWLWHPGWAARFRDMIPKYCRPRAQLLLWRLHKIQEHEPQDRTCGARPFQAKRLGAMLSL
jgi:hypothetical protein